MLSIALVDDDAKDLARSQGLLTEYLTQRPQLGGELCSFSSAGALLEAVQRKDFDVFLLDVVMPGENGIQLGQELRVEGKYGAIIYLTYSPDFAVESYAARAFYYLLKPVKQEELFRVLDDAVNQLAHRQEESMLLRVRDGLRSLTVGQILYAELSDRRLCCRLASGEVVQSVSLRESFREAAAELLRHPCFEMCGVSFAVNLNHVTGISKKAVELEGGLALPLSRAYREVFIRRWIDYSLERGR